MFDMWWKNPFQGLQNKLSKCSIWSFFEKVMSFLRKYFIFQYQHGKMVLTF
jgi:hypothetical protein